jgi:hypothetical protein
VLVTWVTRAVDWLKAYSEPIKILFLVVAAGWALNEYHGKQEETKVARVIDYVNQASDRLAPVQLKVAQFWKDDEDAKKAREISDRPTFVDAIAKLVGDKLSSESMVLFDYYNGLALCVNAGLCSAQAACSIAGQEMRVFLENEGPYFDKLSKEFKYDALKQIRTMIGSACQQPSWRNWLPCWCSSS